MIRKLFKKAIRSAGFDIVAIQNLENEIRRRERQRELAKVERQRQLNDARKLVEPKTAYGKRITAKRDLLEIEGGKLVRPVSVVLDIGCAFRPQQVVDAAVHICCEPYQEYLDRLMLETERDSRFVYLKCEIDEVGRLFPKRSVDSVFLLDVIEHVEKPVGLAALEQLKRIARSQVIVFTPMGFMEQESSEEGVDQWGMGGDKWQRHRSGWLPEDFPLEEGWTTVACEDFFVEDAYSRPLDEPNGAFWAIWTSQ